jgi:hypothetical protein
VTGLLMWLLVDLVSFGASPNAAIPDIVCSQDWDCEEALEIVACESRFSPTAYNKRTKDFGLFQINQYYHARSFPELWPNRFDPWSNTLMAWEIYKMGDNSFILWVCHGH